MNTRSFYKHLLAVVLMLSAVQTIQAQDAFYIYRNDGDFNGFFFDEIVRMGYSKFDLDSVEHDVFVVQEVETTDSLYRIPLAAIDSIGFQQPEILFNERVRNMDELGITPYIKSWTNGWATRLQVSKTLPAALVPKVGDVLMSYQRPNREGDPFIMKVETFGEPQLWNNETDDYYYIWLKPIEDISEVVTQLISVEEIGYDDNGNVRRRIAGCNPDGTVRRGPSNAKTGSHEICLLDLNGSIKRSWSPKDKVSIDLAAEYSLKLKLKVAYNISWKRIFTKLDRSVEFGVTPTVGISASTEFEAMVGSSSILPKSLTSIKFPAACPIFQTSPLPDMFVRGAGSLTAKMSFPSVNFGLGESFTIDTDLPYFPMRYNMYKVPPTEEPSDDTIDSSVSVGLNGFLQMGIKMTGNIATNDWMDKFFSAYIGMDIYCGPRIEGNLELRTPDHLDFGGLWIYNNFKSSTIKASLCSVNLQAKTRIFTFWLEDEEERVFFDGNMSFGDTALAVVPTIKDVKIAYDNDKRLLTSSYALEGGVFVPNEVGMGIFALSDRNRPIRTVLHPDKYSFIHPFKNYSNEWNLDDLPVGSYAAAPVVSLFGLTLPASSLTNFNVLHKLELAENELNFSGVEETKEIHVKNTTCDELRYYCVTQNTLPDWVTVEMHGNKSIAISVKPNMSIKPRKTIIRIVAADKDNSNVTQSRDVVIAQDFCTKSCKLSFSAVVPVDGEDFNSSVSFTMPCTITKESNNTVRIKGSGTALKVDVPHDRVGSEVSKMDVVRNIDFTVDNSGDYQKIVSASYSHSAEGKTTNNIDELKMNYSIGLANITGGPTSFGGPSSFITRDKNCVKNFSEDYVLTHYVKGSVDYVKEGSWSMDNSSGRSCYISFKLSDFSFEELAQP